MYYGGSWSKDDTLSARSFVHPYPPAPRNLFIR